jgi:hypothetical protein
MKLLWGNKSMTYENCGGFNGGVGVAASVLSEVSNEIISFKTLQVTKAATKNHIQRVRIFRFFIVFGS